MEQAQDLLQQLIQAQTKYIASLEKTITYYEKWIKELKQDNIVLAEANTPQEGAMENGTMTNEQAIEILQADCAEATNDVFEHYFCMTPQRLEAFHLAIDALRQTKAKPVPLTRVELEALANDPSPFCYIYDQHGISPAVLIVDQGRDGTKVLRAVVNLEHSHGTWNYGCEWVAYRTKEEAVDAAQRKICIGSQL
jgi:hypothetical protein